MPILHSVIARSLAHQQVPTFSRAQPKSLLSQPLQVCRFNNASCGTFQALTQIGYLYTTVQNVGTLSADYQLTVSGQLPSLDCTCIDRLVSSLRHHTE